MKWKFNVADGETIHHIAMMNLRAPGRHPCLRTAFKATRRSRALESLSDCHELPFASCNALKFRDTAGEDLQHTFVVHMRAPVDRSCQRPAV